MTNAQWFLLVGGILLARGLSASLLKNLPVTPAIVYLLVGLAVGPTVLNVFHFNPLKESKLLEALTEVVVLISLFSAGVKMPAPVTPKAKFRSPVAYCARLKPPPSAGAVVPSPGSTAGAISQPLIV